MTSCMKGERVNHFCDTMCIGVSKNGPSKKDILMEQKGEKGSSKMHKLNIHVQTELHFINDII